MHATTSEEQSQAKPQPSTSTSANAANTSQNTKQNGLVSLSNNNGRTSSCVIDLKAVWFNFAAPPSVPITRKIDYTRLDWNLLSTASPAITAWMNPSNRFAIKLVAMIKAFHLRRTAVAACLMADGLEVQGIQKKPKVNNPQKSFLTLLYYSFRFCLIYRVDTPANSHLWQRHSKKTQVVNCAQLCRSSFCKTPWPRSTIC